MKSREFIGASLILASGFAIACQTLPLPIPPVPISVSWGDLAKALQAGFSNSTALHGAAMMKLDSHASTAVGADTWKKNSYEDYLNYRGPLGGANLVLIQKPCNQTAEEAAKPEQSPPSENTGGRGGGERVGGGGVSQGSGGGGPIGSGCGGGNPRVTVGSIRQL